MTDAPDHRSQWNAYGELWTITDVATRHAACNGVLATGCTYTDPSVYSAGVEEIVAYMARFQENAPGVHFVTEAFLDHHDRSLGGPSCSATAQSSGQAPRSPPTTPPAP